MRRFVPLLSSAILCALLVVVILWKGGKTLESTWVLTGASWLVVLVLLAAHAKLRVKTVSAALPITLIAFLGWSLVSFLHSQTPNYGLDELLRDASLSALLLALSPYLQHQATRTSLLNRVLHTVSVATLLAVLLGIAVYVLQPVNRFVGSFFDFRFHTDYWPNAWAEYLLLAWPLVLLWAQPWRKKAWWARTLVLGIVIGALLLSYSRGAMIAFAGQCVLLALTLLLAHRHSLKVRDVRNVAVIMAGTAIVALLFFHGINAARSHFHPVESVAAKVTFTADEGTSSIDERGQFWNQAVTLTKERPLFGWGPYSFRFTQPKFQEGILATSDHPHNVLLKLTSERGVLAGLLFVALLIVIFLPALRAMVTGNAGHVVPFFCTAACGVLAHNLIDYNLQFVGIALPLWVLFAFLFTADIERKHSVRSTVILMFAFVLASLSFVVTLREARPLLESSKGRHAEVAKDYVNALVYYDKAEAQWLSRDLQLSKVSVLIALHRLPEAEKELITYRALNPVDPRAFTIAGFLKLSLRRPQEALGEFTQAFSRNGQNDASILRGLLLTLQALSRPSLNREWEERLMGLLEQYVDAVEANAHFIALSRNVEELEQSISLAELVYPGRRTELIRLRARLVKEAAEERERLSFKAAGLLW